MGLDINVFSKGISSEVVPIIKKRFLDYNMEIEFHPDFKFDEKSDNGFLPIKITGNKGFSKLYESIDFEIITGFELLFGDYNYETALNESNEWTEISKKSIISRLFKSEQKSKKPNFIVNEYIDSFLKNCKKDYLISWQTHNKSELRISLFFAAFLAELSDGVIYDPQNNRYLTGEEALKTFPTEILEYEESFTQENFKVERFDEWR